MLCAGHAHVKQSSLFLQLRRFHQRSAEREKSFFQTHDENDRKLETLRRMQSHQGDQRSFVIRILIRNERCMVEELTKPLSPFMALFGGRQKLANVLNAA